MNEHPNRTPQSVAQATCAQWPGYLPDALLADLQGGTRWLTSHAGVQTVWHAWPAQPAAHPASPAPTAVLLHGGSGSWTHWVRNVGALRAAGWHVLAPDLPGFGDSGVPHESAADAPDLVAHLHHGLQQLATPEALGPLAAVHVVGFSFGGMVGALWLAQQPQLATQLVLVGSPGLGLTVPVGPKLKGWRHLATPQAQDEMHRHNLMALMLARPTRLDALALDVHRANVLRDRMLRRKLAPTPIVAEHLPRISARVSGIYGELDALYTDTSTQPATLQLPLVQAALAQALQPGAWHTVAGAGHWVNFEDAQAFNACLLQVLADNN